MCGIEMQHLGPDERTAHVNRCIDGAAAPGPEPAPESARALGGKAGPPKCACVVCGVELDGYALTQRLEHIRRCRSDADEPTSPGAPRDAPLAGAARGAAAPERERERAIATPCPPPPAPARCVAPHAAPPSAAGRALAPPAARAEQPPPRRNALSVLMASAANVWGAPSPGLAQQPPPKPSDAFAALMDGARSAARAAAPAPAPTPAQARGRKRGRQPSLFPGAGRPLRPVPAYQRIGGTPFVVDAFRYAPPAGCGHFFLTHFHADHYGGLTRRFCAGLVYATPQTAALVSLRLGVPRERLALLPFDEAVVVCGVRVTAIDANHCPGAALLLFELPDGRAHLHTGDMRWRPEMAAHPAIAAAVAGGRLTLALDTTYCDARYAFPSQQAAIAALVRKASEYAEARRTLLLFGAYSIGKERAFLAAAQALGCKVHVPRARLRLYEAALQGLVDVQATFTTDESATRLRVVPMAHISFARLRALLAGSSRWASVVAFKPTGWAHTKAGGKGGAAGAEADDDAEARGGGGAPPNKPARAGAPLRVRRQGRLTIVEVAYSEHSSFSELRACVRALRPVRCVPTVNAHSAERVTAMLEALYAD